MRIRIFNDRLAIGSVGAFLSKKGNIRYPKVLSHDASRNLTAFDRVSIMY